MEKYSSIVKMEQIKEYLQNGKNEEALEIATGIDLTKIKDKSNYMILAKVFLNNGLLSKAKDCYTKLYEKNPSRHIIMELANLSLRLKSLVEAERYIDEFQRVAPNSFMNHIFKYKVDRLKGKSLDELVVSLEKLKQEEFFDNWGFELAKIYNKLGRTEKCIATCNDVIIWFGEGEYVDKAKALRDSLTKEPIEKLFCDKKFIPDYDSFDIKEFVENFKLSAEGKEPVFTNKNAEVKSETEANQKQTENSVVASKKGAKSAAEQTDVSGKNKNSSVEKAVVSEENRNSSIDLLADDETDAQSSEEATKPVSYKKTPESINSDEKIEISSLGEKTTVNSAMVEKKPEETSNSKKGKRKRKKEKRRQERMLAAMNAAAAEKTGANIPEQVDLTEVSAEADVEDVDNTVAEEEGNNLAEVENGVNITEESDITLVGVEENSTNIEETVENQGVVVAEAENVENGVAIDDTESTIEEESKETENQLVGAEVKAEPVSYSSKKNKKNKRKLERLMKKYGAKAVEVSNTDSKADEVQIVEFPLNVEAETTTKDVQTTPDEVVIENTEELQITSDEVVVENTEELQITSDEVVTEKIEEPETQLDDFKINLDEVVTENIEELQTISDEVVVKNTEKDEAPIEYVQMTFADFFTENIEETEEAAEDTQATAEEPVGESANDTDSQEQVEAAEEKDPFDIDLVVEEISSKISSFDLGDLGVISMTDADTAGSSVVDVTPDDFAKTRVDLKIPDEFEKTRVDLAIPSEDRLAETEENIENAKVEEAAEDVNVAPVNVDVKTEVDAKVETNTKAETNTQVETNTKAETDTKVETNIWNLENATEDKNLDSASAENEITDTVETNEKEAVAEPKIQEIDEDEALIMRLLEEETKNLAYAVKKTEAKPEAPVGYAAGKNRSLDINNLKAEDYLDNKKETDVEAQSLENQSVETQSLETQSTEATVSTPEKVEKPKEAETIQPKEAKLNSSGMLERYLNNNNKKFEEYFGFFAYQQYVSEQLVGMLDVMLSDKKYISFALSTEKGSGKKAIVNGVTKLLADAGQLGSNKPVWAEAMNVNDVDMEKKIPKLEGRSLAIDKAGHLEAKSVEILVKMIKEHNIAVVLIDYSREIAALFKKYPELDEAILNRMNTPKFVLEDLETFVSYKVRVNGLEISDEAYDLIKKKLKAISIVYQEGGLAKTEKYMAEILDNTENRNAKAYLENAMAGGAQFETGMILKEDIPV